MGVAVQEGRIALPRQESAFRRRTENVYLYARRNRSLIVGFGLLLLLLLFVIIGHLTVNVSEAAPLSVRMLKPPSRALPFGSDKQGRNLYAVMVVGTPLTFRLGLICGFLAVTFGAIVGFIAAYYGGIVDEALKMVIDVGLTVPGLLILIILAMRIRGGMTVAEMTFVISIIAWLYPARTIRAQVLTNKQRAYVQIAKLSGMKGPEVIVKELLPNLLPYLVGTFEIGRASCRERV